MSHELTDLRSHEYLARELDTARARVKKLEAALRKIALSDELPRCLFSNSERSPAPRSLRTRPARVPRDHPARLARLPVAVLADQPAGHPMTPWLEDRTYALPRRRLEVLRELPDRSVHMCATSPPFYGLRDYGTGEWEGGDPDCDHDTPIEARRSRNARRDGDHARRRNGANDSHDRTTRPTCGKCGARRVDHQIGLEETPDQWVDRLVAVFREVRRVLRDDGTLWVEIGDSYTAAADYAPDAPIDQARATAKRWATRTLSRRARARHKRARTAGTTSRKTCSASRGCSRSRSAPTAGTSAPKSSGRGRTRCPKRDGPAHQDPIRRCFCCRKQPRYFFDADAIREPPAISTTGRRGRPTSSGHRRQRTSIATGAQMADDNGWRERPLRLDDPHRAHPVRPLRHLAPQARRPA